jgi:hypothetical protein
VIEALSNPTVRERFAKLALDVPSRERQTPEALHVFHTAEIEKWWPILKAAWHQAQLNKMQALPANVVMGHSRQVLV